MQAIASLVSMIISLYSIAIVLRIVLSWGQLGRQNFGSVYSFLSRITDPYLNLFRSIPGLQRGMMDFSPILAMIVLSIIGNIFRIAAAEGRITLGLILALIANAAWSVISFFLVLLIILMAVRIFYELKPSANSINYISILDSLLKGFIDTVHRLLFSGKEMAVRTLLYASVAALVALYLVLRITTVYLVSFLSNLSF